MQTTKELLDIFAMSPADAQHNLNVLFWLFAHQEELEAKAKEDNAQVASMNDIVANGGFNGWRETEDETKMLDVSIQRLFPVTVKIFSDDIALDDDPLPLNSLQIGDNETLYPQDEENLNLICGWYGIDPDEQTWMFNNPWEGRDDKAFHRV